MKIKYVAYYRVSTDKQGESGLGLGAQKEQIANYAKQKDADIIAEFQEVESGKKDNRPQLNKAIEAANLSSAVLLIAKLDRLSRNVAFIFTLRDTGVEFECCDIPEANTLTIGIFATMAQFERERISSRTKDALAVRRARGAKLGTPDNFTNEGRHKGGEIMRQKALNNPDIQKATAQAFSFRKEGLTLAEIAEQLNKLQYKTPRGSRWGSGSVHRILNRVI